MIDRIKNKLHKINTGFENWAHGCIQKFYGLPFSILFVYIWDFSGLKFVYGKLFPRIKSEPSTFSFWILGIYFTTFAFASNRYENRRDAIENRVSSLLSLLHTKNYPYIIEQYQKLQKEQIPPKPNLGLSFTEIVSPIVSFLEPESIHDHDLLDPLKNIIHKNRFNLNNAILVKGDLRFPINWERANFENSDLSKALIRNSELRKSNFKNAVLIDAHLEGADLRFANLEDANLVRANLEGTYLSYANLEDANLNSTNLERADLREAHLGGAELWEAHLEGAYLTIANLEGANLRGANLTKATLNGIYYDEKSRFDSVKIGEETLSDAKFRKRFPSR